MDRNTELNFFAPCAQGTETILAAELSDLGARAPTPTRGGVTFLGTIETGYRACLWSRLASRILLKLAAFPAETPEELYAGSKAFPWEDHFSPETTFAVDFTSVRSAITHTNYGAQVVKDGLVDRFRERTGLRPSVDRFNPGLRFNVHILDNQAELALDLAGDRLHRRGWRRAGGEAPLKETLAAAILTLAGWKDKAAAGMPLLDPLCGSGTLCIEAALMALDTAPGLLRERFGFHDWRHHSPELWEDLLQEARNRDRRSSGGKGPVIVGLDRDGGAIRMALENLETAGLRGKVHFERRDLPSAEPPSPVPGVFVTNPPYGVRLSDEEGLAPLYKLLGDSLKQRFPGWQAWILTGNPGITRHIGLRIARRHILFNGPIECRLLEIPIMTREETEARNRERVERPLAPDVEAFANRLKKNLSGLDKWLKKEGHQCYRMYDKDLPDFAFSLDRYGDQVHLQEYERPSVIDELRANQRIRDGITAVSRVLGVPRAKIHAKQRFRQRGATQYTRVAEIGEFLPVEEQGLKFLVNLTDYHDAGLFLDHRPMRARIRELASGRWFLNLFAYTGTASVYAAAGGARATTTVDLSNAYLDWARRNMELNGFRGPEHQFVKADCLQWLERVCNRAAQGDQTCRWNLIYVDPPTFSNSKEMETTFDVQRDHVALLDKLSELLMPDGIILFSNNFRRFQMDHEALPHLDIKDITRESIPKDFERNARIHNAWELRLKK